MQPSCPNVERCVIYPRLNEMGREALQEFYCRGSFVSCSRYVSAKRGVIPPEDLLPDGRRLGTERKAG